MGSIEYYILIYLRHQRALFPLFVIFMTHFEVNIFIELKKYILITNKVDSLVMSLDLNMLLKMFNINISVLITRTSLPKSINLKSTMCTEYNGILL